MGIISSDNNDLVSLQELKDSIKQGSKVGQELQKEYGKQKQESSNLIDKLNNIRVLDIRIKIILRCLLTCFFLALLIGQNYFVFQLINQTISLNQLKEVQPILGTLIGGTLAETYFIVKEIVKWAMKDIDYK